MKLNNKGLKEESPCFTYFSHLISSGNFLFIEIFVLLLIFIPCIIFINVIGVPFFFFRIHMLSPNFTLSKAFVKSTKHKTWVLYIQLLFQLFALL